MCLCYAKYKEKEMLFHEFFDIVGIMNLCQSQKRFLQQLGFNQWVVKSNFLLIRVSGNDAQMVLRFCVTANQDVQKMLLRICRLVGLDCMVVDQADEVIDCACDPRQIYEKIRACCLKKGG